MDIQSVTIEGGAKILNLFISADLWDEARVFTGPECWAKGIASPVLHGELFEPINVGPDTLQVWRNSLT